VLSFRHLFRSGTELSLSLTRCAQKSRFGPTMRSIVPTFMRSLLRATHPSRRRLEHKTHISESTLCAQSPRICFPYRPIVRFHSQGPSSLQPRNIPILSNLSAMLSPCRVLVISSKFLALRRTPLRTAKSDQKMIWAVAHVLTRVTTPPSNPKPYGEQI
jgi:hypothetical protein